MAKVEPILAEYKTKNEALLAENRQLRERLSEHVTNTERFASIASRVSDYRVKHPTSQVRGNMGEMRVFELLRYSFSQACTVITRSTPNAEYSFRKSYVLTPSRRTLTLNPEIS